VLRQIDAVLGHSSSLTQFISHHEDQNLLAVWAFACHYRLQSALKSVEAEMLSRPLRITGGKPKQGVEYQQGLDEAVRCVSSIPSSSSDVGLSSLMRLLYRTDQGWGNLATELHAKIDKAFAQVRNNSFISNRGHHCVRGSAVSPILAEFSKLAQDLGPV
jgi:hypothetical protein